MHKKFNKIENLDGTAVIETENDWVAGDTGETLCSDVRTLTFGTLGDSRYIDFDITITAVADDVEFGDTKEGCMGIRVPGTMKTDSKLGGHLVNSHGDMDGDAWGKRSPWVDYYGPVEDEKLGIAIMNHRGQLPVPDLVACPGPTACSPQTRSA